MTTNYFIGVDVGTSSVRAGLYSNSGHLIAFQTQQISIYNPQPNFYEQSSQEIWSAVCECVKDVSKKAPSIDSILSIGFDATCSLVAVDKNDDSLPVNASNDSKRDIIMWMDHRAEQEAQQINSTSHKCLSSVGGKISPEMDPPKMLWLKKNLKDICYSKARFFSLPDWLYWRCTRDESRSMCTVVCKWLYEASETHTQWNEDFLRLIGLEELVELNFEKIGAEIRAPFTASAKICYQAAVEFGLSQMVKVGISLIDAHAGGVGAMSLACGILKKSAPTPDEVLVLVSGTSTCHMASSARPNFIQGVWGPYYSAMMPSMWLNEAGQSAAGKLIDFMVKNHPAYRNFAEKYGENKVYETLNEVILPQLAEEKGLESDKFALLTRSIHVYPDFHGNRSPIADFGLTGAISGLTFDTSETNLALTYLATVQSLALQTRHIIEHMKLNSDYNFKLIVGIGGLAKNNIYCKMHSDICGLKVLVPSDSDAAVLLGACISGAFSASNNSVDGFREFLENFSHDAKVNFMIEPTENKDLKEFYENKYKVYTKMMQNQIEIKKIMG